RSSATSGSRATPTISLSFATMRLTLAGCRARSSCGRSARKAYRAARGTRPSTGRTPSGPTPRLTRSPGRATTLPSTVPPPNGPLRKRPSGSPSRCSWALGRTWMTSSQRSARSTRRREHLVLRAILDNPIAVREWRVLRRRAGDWRIWVGLKWPLDPIVWGAPVVLTYAVAPYMLWAVLLCLRGLHLSGGGRIPFDAFTLLAL